MGSHIIAKVSSSSRESNRPVSHRDSGKELEKSNRELLERQEKLREETTVLMRAFQAIGDSLIQFRAGAVIRANPKGRILLNKLSQDQIQSLVNIETGQTVRFSKTPYLVRGNRIIARTEEIDRLITLRDLSDEEAIQKRVLESKDQERKRTMADLEHQLGEDLQTIHERLEVLIRDDLGENEQLPQILQLVETCIAESRPGSLSSSRKITSRAALQKELESLAHDFAANFHYPIHLTIKELPSFIEDTHWTELFLLIQEGLRNSWRHSGGSSACLIIEKNQIALWDDGSGLSPEQTNSEGVGLKSLLARSERIGFEAQVMSPPRNGWIFARKVAE